MIIRTAVKADLPMLEWYGLFWQHRDVIEQTFQKQQEGDALMLVLDWNKHPAGQIWIDFESKRKHGTAILWALRVVPWVQKLGLGSKLLQIAEEQIVRRGFNCAELGVEIGREDLRAYYEKRGYDFSGQLGEPSVFRNSEGELVTTTSELWLFHKELGEAEELDGMDV